MIKVNISIEGSMEKYRKGEGLKCPRCQGELVRLVGNEYVCNKCFTQIKGSRTERIKWHDLAVEAGHIEPWEIGSKYL